MDTCAFQGKEEQTYNQSMYTKNSINKAITDKSKLAEFLSAPERLVPPHMNPACHRMSMQVRVPSMIGSIQLIPQEIHDSPPDPILLLPQVGTFVSAKSNNGCVGPENNRRISGMLKRSNSGTPGSSHRQGNNSIG